MALLKNSGNFNKKKSKSETKLGVKERVKITGRNWAAYNYQLKRNKRALALGKIVQSNSHLLPPRVCEALGISSYTYLSRTYPPYCVRAFHQVLSEVCEPPLTGTGDIDPPLNSIKAHSSQPDGVTVAQGPPAHCIVDHTLPSEDCTAQGVSSVEVRVAAPPLQFPGVFMRELHRNNRGCDIMQFFRGLPIVDMFLVVTNKSFTGDAFVVFSNTYWADDALKKDGEMMGDKAVRVFPCSKQDYYNAVASALNGKFDFSGSLANPTDPSPTNNNLMEQPLIFKSDVMADMSCPDYLLGQSMSMSLCENIMENGRYSPEAKSILEEDKNSCNGVEAPANDGLTKIKAKKRIKHSRKAKRLSEKDHHIVRICCPDYFADTNVISHVFGDCDLSSGRIHIVLHPDGKPTGKVLLELVSEEDANKVLSKDNTMVGSHHLKILPATMEDLRAKTTGKKEEIGGNDMVKEPNDEPKLPDSHLQSKSEKSNDNQKSITRVLSVSDVMSDMSYPDRPLVQSSTLSENIIDHGQSEPEAKSILEKDENNCNGGVTPAIDVLDKIKPKKRTKRCRKPKRVLKKGHHILRVCCPDYFADTAVITSLFQDCDLSNDRVHILFHPDGKPTGEVLLEVVSDKDANKVLSKNNTILGPHLLKILLATIKDLPAKVAEQKQEIGGSENSNDNPKVITGVLRMSNVPPSADQYDIIELFGQSQLLPENLHCDREQNGMATGVVYVEFNSVEDAKKALSKNMSKIQSQCVELSISSKEQAIQALNGNWSKKSVLAVDTANHTLVLRPHRCPLQLISDPIKFHYAPFQSSSSPTFRSNSASPGSFNPSLILCRLTPIQSS